MFPGSPPTTPQTNPLKFTGSKALRFRPVALRQVPAGLFICFVLLTFPPGQASAQFIRASSFSVENDGLVFWTPPHDRTDRYYTNGLAAQAVVAWAPRWARLLSEGEPRVCPPDPGPDPCFLTRVTIGQSIFTPAFLFNQAPPTGDRPYAGWLYLRATTARIAKTGSRSLGIEIGVTGEPSLASPAHRWVHRALGKAEPTGWDHQIPFELAFSVAYEARTTVSLLTRESGPSLQLEPHGSLALGTLRTGGVGGLSFRAGWNAPPTLDWWGPGSGTYYLLLTGGLEAELVLRDLFIDGSTWKESPSTERTPVVGRASVGLELGTGPLAVSFVVTRSSIQFTHQLGSHSVGAVSIVIRP